MKQLFVTSALIAATVLTAAAQDFKMPAPSPTTTISQDFSTSKIEINYSRPAIRGRVIFGELVPYGKVWRTGANGATKLTFGEDVNMAGKQLKAGTYALYTIPTEKEWKVIINTGVSNWGVSGFDDKDDVIAFSVPVQKTSETVQSFTISIDNITINSADITMAWENTKVVIPIKADNNDRIVQHLEKELQGEKPPFQQAANYFLETNQQLEKAAAYADKAIDANPDAFYLYWLKARILDKQGKHQEAIAAAQKAADSAASTPYAEEYKGHLKELQKGK